MLSQALNSVMSATQRWFVVSAVKSWLIRLSPGTAAVALFGGANTLCGPVELELELGGVPVVRRVDVLDFNLIEYEQRCGVDGLLSQFVVIPPPVELASVVVGRFQIL